MIYFRIRLWNNTWKMSSAALTIPEQSDTMRKWNSGTKVVTKLMIKNNKSILLSWGAVGLYLASQQ